MSKAYGRIKEGLSEALSIAKGEQPAASITVNGHTYIPKAELDEALRRYDERNRTAIERAGYVARCAEIKSEIERLRPHYQSNSMLDHGRRQMLDHFERLLSGNANG